MSLVTSGTPFVGYATLTNGALGPVNFAIYTNAGQPAYTLGAAGGIYPQAERCYITSVSLSSNDPTIALVTIDSGGTTPTKIASQYLSSVQPPALTQFAPGVCRCIPGVVPRATASAVTAGKSVQCVIKGFVSRS